MIIEHSEKFTPVEVNVQIRNQEAYQLIYASQLYGTFFVIGATFEIDDDKLKKIHLSINNYKGLYNIKLLKSTRNRWSKLSDTGVITLDLQVDNGKNSDDLVDKIAVELPDAVSLDDINNLFVTRDLKSFRQADEMGDHLHENFFDSEFYERDGQYIAAKNRLDVYLPNEPTEYTIKTGTACKNTLVRLIK